MTDGLRQRQPRVQNKPFLDFVRTQKCCNPGCGRWPTEAAHVRMACPERDKRETGMGERPSDRWAVPLCSDCHREDRDAQHRGGERKFWERLGVDPFAVAAELFAEFEGAPTW